MCDEKVIPQTVTVEYTGNTLGQLASIQEAEPLIIEALGMYMYLTKNAKFKHWSSLC